MRIKYCPKCGQNYSASQRFCESDQEVLSLKDPYHLVGQTLLDKYKILALVGVGGMGAVYCAHHLGIDRRVAFKILQPNVAIGNDYVVELFEREAKLAGRLTHENIVDVKDAGHTPDGIAYIVMEWLEGQTLDQELAIQGSFSFTRAIGILRQIAAALSEAHAKRIIHRDLKPANVMLVDTVGGRDQVKVLDFGIGKIIEETTANSPVSAMVGTPQYASPEQLTVGGHIDGRSDIYSLGVIGYRLLGGQLPFSSSSMGELVQMQLTVMPQPLRAIRPETPLALEQLINSMLAKDPALRPQSANEVLASLKKITGQLKLQEVDPEDLEETLVAVKAGKKNGIDLAEQTTEDLFATAKSPSLGKIGQDSPKFPAVAETAPFTSIPGRRNKSYVVYGIAVMTMIAAAVYGFYQYGATKSGTADPAANERALGSVMPSPSPAATQSNITQPTPGVGVVSTPEISPTQAALPSPTVNRALTQANQQKAAEYFQRARALYNQGEFQNALRECDQSLKLNPQQPEVRKFRQKITDTIKVLNRR